MPILLPVAGLSLGLVLLLAVGGMVGGLSGLFGVGGGFLLTPVLMMIGVPPTVAAASGSCQMVATSSSGMAAHSRQGNVDMKIGSILLIGGLVGAEFGVEAIKYLHRLGEASLTIELSYVLVLGGLGSYMFLQSLQTLRRGALARTHHEAGGVEGRLSWLPWQMNFPRSGVRHSILVPMFLSFIVGILASIMGVGGGFIMLPMMVYILGMPMHIAVGTSLFQILFLCAGVTYMQAATNQTVDLMLVLPLALGSAVGAQLGARLSRLLRGEQLMILLAIIVLAVTGEMVSKLILHPSSLLRAPSVMHGEGTATPAGNASHAGLMISLGQMQEQLQAHRVSAAAATPLDQGKTPDAEDRARFKGTAAVPPDEPSARLFSRRGVATASGNKSRATAEFMQATNAPERVEACQFCYP